MTVAFWLALRDAVRSLWSNKMRSMLTVLGIVIGVAAVIAMLAIGRGAEAAITSSIEGIGTNLLFVAPGQIRTGTNLATVSRRLTLGDARALEDPLAAPAVAAVAPVIMRDEPVTAEGKSHMTTILGVTPAYADVRNYHAVEGRFINETDEAGRASVAVLAPDAAEALFGRKDGLVGTTIRIRGQPFRVIGVMETKGGGMMGVNQDDRVFIPLSTAMARMTSQPDQVDLFMISAVSPEQVSAAREQIAAILRTRHRLRPDQEDDFTIFTQEEFLGTFQAITQVLTIFLGGIAGISLLVGGIGIMNIMLVSVTERTREIGLRKALGARKRDILIQFLTEAMLLSLVGGLLGIALGWGISLAVGKIAAAVQADIVPEVGIDAVLLATLFSAAVGIFFGLYPANRAASLEPVEALRHE